MHLFKNNFLLLLLSSFLMGLSQHPLGLGFLSWFGLVPFIYVFYNIKIYRQNISYSLFWGFSYHIIVVFWLAFNIGAPLFSSVVSMFLTVIVLTFNTVMIGVLWHIIRVPFKKIFFLPFIWCAVEYSRSFGVLGFPWVSIANSQTDYFYLIQNSEIFGIYGISFWLVLVNVFVYLLIFDKNKCYLKFSFLFLVPFISGYFLYTSLEENVVDDYKVSIIQPNIDLIKKRDFNSRYENLDNLIEESKECITEGSNLIIWPESALSYNSLQDSKILNYIIYNLLDNTDVYLLTGNIIYQDGKSFNSSVLINKDGIVDIYHKRQLVPVAEYVPLSNKISKLKTLNLGQANFSMGERDLLFNVKGEKFPALICFESTFPNINRRHAQLGADFITYLVNDGWYTTPPQPQQHMKQSIYRAIENRKTVLRCANTGISAIIDPSGEVRSETELNKKAKITTFIKKGNRVTFYTYYGNVFAIIVLIITLGFTLLTIYRNVKES